MFLCAFGFLLVSSLRFLTIVYGWNYTVVCILEERLFGVHARKVLEDCDVITFWGLFSMKGDTYRQLKFWMALTIFCIELSVSLCPWVAMNPQSPSVSKYLPELIKWKSLLPGNLKETSAPVRLNVPAPGLIWYSHCQEAGVDTRWFS